MTAICLCVCMEAMVRHMSKSGEGERTNVQKGLFRDTEDKLSFSVS